MQVEPMNPVWNEGKGESLMPAHTHRRVSTSQSVTHRGQGETLAPPHIPGSVTLSLNRCPSC